MRSCLQSNPWNEKDSRSTSIWPTHRLVMLISGRFGCLLALLLLFGCTAKQDDRGAQESSTANADSSSAELTSARAPSQSDSGSQTDQETVRFATFNVALYRNQQGALKKELESGDSSTISQLAEIIQRVRPNVLLLNEFDYDAGGEGVQDFQKNFLNQPQNDQQPIEYEFVYFQAVNTGVDSGLDLNKDGKLGTANDAYGFGKFPGQYGMVVLSQFPIDWDNIRTFQNFLWKDMPGLCWPIDPKTEKPYYDQEARAIFRLSSKSHWDVPIQIGDRTIHFLVSHPTPPVFDDDEDRNGCRNHDEIRFWVDYIGSEAGYIYDDNGKTGGLAADSQFVIAGDLNADPVDGDSHPNAARQLTENERINNSFTPQSEGGVYYAKEQGGKNKTQQGNPALDTGDFNDSGVGNMRIDYCLPSDSLQVTDSGVFWPKPDQPGGDLVGASDHRLVWIDIVK